MTSEERVMKAVGFEKTDIIPLWKIAHIGSFTQNWRKFLGLDDSAEPDDYYGYDTAVYNLDESFFPSEKGILSDDGDSYLENDGFGSIVRRLRSGYFPNIVEYRMKNRRDLESLEFESIHSPLRITGLNEFMESSKNKCRFARTGGIYIRSHRLWPEDKLLADMILEPGFCSELFSRVASHMLGMSLKTLEATDTWETGLWVYDDMAATYSPMFSPELFEKYLYPLYSDFIATCKEKGCRHVFFHSDGNILPFMDMLLEAGFDGFNPLEYRSGLDIVELRTRYGTKAVFFGGICNTEILPRGDKREIEAHVKPMIELARYGGIVMGTASVTGDVPPEAFDYCMSLIRPELESSRLWV